MTEVASRPVSRPSLLTVHADGANGAPSPPASQHEVQGEASPSYSPGGTLRQVK